MDKKEKELLDNFLYVRNNGLLFNKCNVDVNGKATIVDPEMYRSLHKNKLLELLKTICNKQRIIRSTTIFVEY